MKQESGMDGWQPIETAPRDGTYVALRSGEGDDVGCWQEARYCMIGAPQGAYGPGWIDSENHLPISGEFEPTHWRLLDMPEDNELPGMWSRADLLGGETDAIG